MAEQESRGGARGASRGKGPRRDAREGGKPRQNSDGFRSRNGASSRGGRSGPSGARTGAKGRSYTGGGHREGGSRPRDERGNDRRSFRPTGESRDDRRGGGSARPYGKDARRRDDRRGNEGQRREGGFQRAKGRPFGSSDKRFDKRAQQRSGASGRDDRRKRSYDGDERRGNRSARPYGNDDRRRDDRSARPYSNDDRRRDRFRKEGESAPFKGPRAERRSGGSERFKGARDGRPQGDRHERRDRSGSFEREPHRDRDFGRRNDRSISERPAASGRNRKPGSSDDKRAARPAQAGRKRAEAPRDKKSFDAQKVARLMENETVYRGELDPLRGQREKIAPGRKTRELREAQEAALRAAELEERRESRGKDGLKPLHPCEASPARLAALEVTRLVRVRNAYAQDLISSMIDESDLSTADRAFATLLVLGVVSTSGTLDELVDRALDRPADAFNDVRDALRISVYELVFLKKAPHAALDQGVELVRAVSPSAAGLGNAVLHRVFAFKDEFPFGDPNHDLEALARVYAFPKWLAGALVEDLGAKEAAAFMHASNEPAPLFVSVNALKATDQEVEEVFAAAGAFLTPAEAGGIAPAGCYHVSAPRALVDAGVRALFDGGKILVSDAAAQVVASCALPADKPGSVLEVGSGRGTKTILIQSEAQRRYGEQVVLTSLDLHAFKMDLLRERAVLYGVELADTLVANATRLESQIPARTYSTVFVDAPCSGLGTLRRHPEIRWRVTKKRIAALADTSLAILQSAAAFVEDGGRLVFSTCTVTHAENNGVVKRFLESEQGASFSLAPLEGRSAISTQLTVGSPDAHFAACFVKAASPLSR